MTLAYSLTLPMTNILTKTLSLRGRNSNRYGSNFMKSISRRNSDLYKKNYERFTNYNKSENPSPIKRLFRWLHEYLSLTRYSLSIKLEKQNDRKNSFIPTLTKYRYSIYRELLSLAKL